MDATAAVVKGKEQPFEIGGISIGEPRPDRLVKFYELEEINQAAEDSENGEVLKAILKMPS